mmetsp:Transcript_17120/g.43424  ORF Transcript_17120/g.43424 Transcript_17120/m.43424 type:complete len:249 (-) Transcript_17120:67-813(-)
MPGATAPSRKGTGWSMSCQPRPARTTQSERACMASRMHSSRKLAASGVGVSCSGALSDQGMRRLAMNRAGATPDDSFSPTRCSAKVPSARHTNAGPSALSTVSGGRSSCGRSARDGIRCLGGGGGAEGGAPLDLAATGSSIEGVGDGGGDASRRRGRGKYSGRVTRTTGPPGPPVSITRLSPCWRTSSRRRATALVVLAASSPPASLSWSCLPPAPRRTKSAALMYGLLSSLLATRSSPAYDGGAYPL